MTLEDLNGINRAMAWERAKGELGSILATYISEPVKFQAMDDLVTQLIDDVERMGLAE